VGGEDADDAEVGSISKNHATTFLNTFPGKDHFFGSVLESHK